jgi:hypothetical protein
VDKPKSVVLYNKTMGGVDLSDAQLYLYLSERKSLKWTTKVVLSLIGRALLNAYIVYVQNTSNRKPKSRHDFLIAVIKNFTEDYRPPSAPRSRRSQADIAAGRAAPVMPPLRPSPWDILIGHDLTRVENNRLRDCVAHQGDKRKRTVFQCISCRVGLCPECFSRYHRRPRYH